MLKKYFAVVLIILLAAAPPVWAKSKTEKEAQQIEKIKTAILKLSAGPDARVSLKLRDQTKVSGYIREAGAESFVVVDAAATATTVSYPNVIQVKGNNLSTGAKVAIVLGIVAAVLGILVFFENYG